MINQVSNSWVIVKLPLNIRNIKAFSQWKWVWLDFIVPACQNLSQAKHMFIWISYIYSASG